MHPLNFFFHKIYLITLPDSPREARMAKRLEGIDYEIFYGVNGGTLDKTPYIEMGSSQTRGQLGCTLSHYNLYKKILKEGHEKTLILEDDCSLNNNMPNLGLCLEQLPEKWGMFYLGWHPSHLNLPGNFSSNLCEISRDFFVSLHGTHAIALRPWYIKRLVELNKTMTYTADGLLTATVAEYDLKTYAAVPSMADPEGVDSVTEEMDIIYGH